MNQCISRSSVLLVQNVSPVSSVIRIPLNTKDLLPKDLLPKDLLPNDLLTLLTLTSQLSMRSQQSCCFSSPLWSILGVFLRPAVRAKGQILANCSKDPRTFGRGYSYLYVYHMVLTTADLIRNHPLPFTASSSRLSLDSSPRIIWPRQYRHTTSMRASRRLFDMSGVRYRQYVPTRDRITIDFSAVPR